MHGVLTYKQMTKRCDTGLDSRAWKREEMTAYLDWDKAEEERIDAKVMQEVQRRPFGTGSRRTRPSIWEEIERDSEEQQARYSRCVPGGDVE